MRTPRRTSPSYFERLLVILWLGPSACTPPASPVGAGVPQPPATAGTAPPQAHELVEQGPKGEPVVVALVVDQFAAWLANDRLDTLPQSGGFARLQREGSTVVALRYAHAITDTAPGHAALFTGAPPSVSSAYANQALDPSTGRAHSLLSDPSTKVVDLEGIDGAPGSSAAMLTAESVADRLRKERPDALIVSISIKDRGAIFAGGRSPTVSLWFDSSKNSFVSSTAFVNELPDWARAGSASRVAALLDPWKPLDPSWLKIHAAESDAAPGEGTLPGLGTTFPHEFRAAERPDLAFRVSPRGDRAVIDLGLAAIQALPFGKRTGLLVLSLSSTDYVGHVYGPDSWEWWDNFRRLDAELARLFDALDDKLGEEGYAVLLSADHGVGVMPETHANPRARTWCQDGSSNPFERPCGAGGRVLLGNLVPKLEKLAERMLGPGHWVLGASNPYIYLTEAARSIDAAKRERLLRALTLSIEKNSGIETVYSKTAMPRPCPPPEDESPLALICRSFSEGAGDLYVVTRPGWYLDTGYVPRHGVNHGSYRLYDRSVPLLARAPGRIAAGRVLESPLSFATFTRTLSALLGISAPAAAFPGESLTAPMDAGRQAPEVNP